MKKLLLLIFAFTTSTLIAQVGINTTAPSAMLHIYGTTVPGSAGGTLTYLTKIFRVIQLLKIIQTTQTVQGMQLRAGSQGQEMQM